MSENRINEPSERVRRKRKQSHVGLDEEWLIWKLSHANSVENLSKTSSA